MIKKFLIFIFIIALNVVLACSNKDETPSTNASDTTKQNVEQKEQPEDNVEQKIVTKEQASEQKQITTKKDAPKVKAGLTENENEKLQKTFQEHCQNPEKQMRATNVSFTDGALFSGKYEISYTINNRSDLISIRNITFRVDYLDAEDNIIGTDKHTFYNTFKPKTRLDTMMKSPRIKGTDKVKIVCIDAECVK